MLQGRTGEGKFKGRQQERLKGSMKVVSNIFPVPTFTSAFSHKFSDSDISAVTLSDQKNVHFTLLLEY